MGFVDETCSSCGGSGYVWPDKNTRCIWCNGSGRVRKFKSDDFADNSNKSNSPATGSGSGNGGGGDWGCLIFLALGFIVLTMIGDCSK